MPNPTIKCLYAVAMADGIGDLVHFTDFIARISAEELANANFIIFPEVIENETIQEKLDSLPSNHPLQRADLKEKLMIVDDEEGFEKIKEIVGESHFSYCQVSNDNGWICLDEICENSTQYTRTYLFEHHGHDSFQDNSDFWAFGSNLGLHTRSPGVFIPVSEKSQPLEPGLLENLGIPEDCAFTICTSRAAQDKRFEFLIEQLCWLNAKFTNKLVICCPDEDLQLSDTMQSLLTHTRCSIIKKESWSSESEFKQLRILQAKTSLFAVASGDKSLETCFAEGLFPIIEFHHNFKEEFWSDLNVTLYTLNNNANDADKVLVQQIRGYIDASIDHCHYNTANSDANLMMDDDIDAAALAEKQQKKFKALIESIKKMQPDAITYWQQVICPIICTRFNVNEKIAENLKIFRMLVELVHAPNSEYANAAKAYFSGMESTKYDKLTKSMVAAVEDRFTEAKMIAELMQIRTNAVLLGFKPELDEILKHEQSARSTSSPKLSL